jgi:hypothetical protein
MGNFTGQRWTRIYTDSGRVLRKKKRGPKIVNNPEFQALFWGHLNGAK